ncbi:4-hydroxy-3-methylbut-2-enyl diphosphate reductase [Natronoflexus pectinivorans]|uniref:4-hydroxy-3-methylbut-2-enyl diphosphate reductase n=1 Tax=Natronoflexus pectinivorans TaxID=682526 RepID=A0A4R2GPH5_9BACT|nr:4-hydroxy-3-methylbut-2-enyl diphosphate reductase [Natronoflexus pectinivorans]TCO10609.1 4-hydroxy-3-methylbut-2-enyl diphosphate reductase [Natronoflexus pectinivorans]
MMDGSMNMQKLIIEVDKKSGFCFGVARAVKLAEESLNKGDLLSSLGDIVHNEEEVNRLKKKGMGVLPEACFEHSNEQTILFRAHGEPPATYKKVEKSGAKLIDATCPVVLKLQERVKKAWKEMQSVNGQIIIYGKKGHAEVRGLVGQTNDEAIVIQFPEEIKNLAPNKPTILFSQTTMSYSGFDEISNLLEKHLIDPDFLKVNRTICAQVGNRVPHLQDFSSKYDVVLFVGGKKSSNGQFLFEVCKKVNPATYYVTGTTDVKKDWFSNKITSIGICGATSTPQWLMENLAESVKRLLV